MSFTIGSLFDGSGGFPLAASLCGGVPKWASEVEPYPIAVTKSRFPNVKHLGSVTDIKGGEVEPVDVITFGSPCQDLSVAGKRAGLKHEANGDDETTRSGLFMEAVRIIKEMREATNGVYPRFALWENVPGAFSSNKGEDFRIVLEELIKVVEPTAVMPEVPKNGWPYADSYCGDGWSIAYRVLDAQFWGVPQRRRRIYLVADFRGECAGKVSFEREGLRGYFETGRTPWQTAAGDAEDGSGAADCENILRDLTPASFYPQMKAESQCFRNDNVCNTLVNGTNPGFQNAIVVPVIAVDQGGGKSGANSHNDLSPTLTCTHGGEPVVAYTLKIRSGCEGGGKGDLVQTDMSATLATNNDQYLFQPIPIHDQATRFSGKRGDKSDGKGNGLGIGNPGDPMNTLTSGDRHAVAYAMQAFGDYKESDIASGLKARDYKDATDLVCKPIVFDRAFFNQGQNTQYDPQLYTDGTVPTLVAKGPAGGCVRYIVRRLTPTECARLQGFPDTWGHPDVKTDLTDEEYQFWLNVRNTHAAINGKKVQDYTEAQMVTWYNKLQSDANEYKMWGNGIALPNALYVMQGIAEVMSEEKSSRRKWLMNLLGDCL